MTAMELEIQKSRFVRDVLNETDEDVLRELILFFRRTKDKFVKVSESERNKEKRKKLNEALDKCLVDLSGFTFNRDEANDYE
ncbi:MAG: hypothetical protein LBN71_07835 [Tannerella sp.]|jgi:hypothetical protein|nr:hypothetical protein [Tannerella sp.]